MDNSEQKRESPKTGSSVRHDIRLPGFITDEEIGLGDLVKKATYAVA